MALDKDDPIFGAAVLKLTFINKGIADQPGFRVVYFGTLKELGVTESQVNKYIRKNRVELEEIIKKKGKTGD